MNQEEKDIIMNIVVDIKDAEKAIETAKTLISSIAKAQRVSEKVLTKRRIQIQVDIARDAMESVVKHLAKYEDT